MGLTATEVILPGNGTILIGPVDTTPVDYKTVDVSAPGEIKDWTVSHTSRENPPKFTKDGGSANILGSWEVDALYNRADKTTVGIEFSKLQISKENLAYAFGLNGGNRANADGSFDVKTIGPTEVAVQVIMQDGSKRCSVYMPRLSLAIGDLPEIDTENFFELAFAGTGLNSETTGLLMKWFPVAPFKAATDAPAAG